MTEASHSQETIEQLIKAGVNVFRLNFSFGTYEDMARFIQYIKTASAKLNVVTTILGDLQGPKFRTGEQDTEVITLTTGQKLKLAYAPKKTKSGNSEIIYCPHEDLMTALKVSDKVVRNRYSRSHSTHLFGQYAHMHWLPLDVHSHTFS